MAEFISNITFGPAPSGVPTEKQRWDRYAGRFVRDIEDFLESLDGHCCNCQPELCAQYRNPGDCGCIYSSW